MRGAKAQTVTSAGGTVFIRYKSTRCRPFGRLLLGSALLFFLGTSAAWATTYTWNSTSSTDWFTGTNWTPSGPPTSADTAVINLGASGPIVTATGALASAVDVGTASTGGTLGVQSAGTLTDTNSTIGGGGFTGTVTVTGTGSTWTNSNDLYLGYSGVGVLNVESGGDVSSAQVFMGYNSGESGTATVTGTG